MKTFLLLLLLAFSSVSYAEETTPLPSHKIDYPQGWQTWSSIAVSHRTDNNTVRAILGNEIAVNAARSGEQSPWPDGAILAKVVWKAGELAHWPKAIGPKDFVHAEFMFKDSVKYADTYGWGWARWVGAEQTPFEGGMQVCVSCHTPVKDKDWVFTEPGWFPTN